MFSLRYKKKNIFKLSTIPPFIWSSVYYRNFPKNSTFFPNALMNQKDASGMANIVNSDQAVL